MSEPIDISPSQRKELLALIQRHLPNVEVWAFGSRVKWTARSNSDLDLVAFAKPEDESRVSRLKEALEESSLPFRVDLLVWENIPENFKNNIREYYVVLVEAEKTGLSGNAGTHVQWFEKPLSEVTVNHDGKRRPVKESERKKGPFPYYGASGIVDYVDGYLFDGRYLLIAEDGENLRTRQTPIAFMVDGKFWVNNHAHIVTGNDEVTTEYLHYFLQNADIQSYLTGAVMPKLTQGNLNRIPVRYPEPLYQKLIARVLGSLDHKIDLNRRINQTLEAMAQAIFKSWFVDFDPVKAKIAAKAEGRDPLRAAMTAISGKPDAELDTLPPDQFASLAATAALFPDEVEDSELGEIPRGWCAAPFGSMLAHTIGGDWGSDAPDVTNDTRVAIIRGTDLPDLDQAQTNRVPIRYTTQKKLANRRMQMGDIVLEVSGGSRDQPTGRSLRLTANAMREFDCPVEPASFCRLLRPVSVEIGVILGLHLSYIYQQGKTWEYQNQSTGIANFQTVHFLEAELVARPPTAVSDAFFKLVNPILERRHDPQGRHLAELRDTLLPKLLAGELQVQHTELEVAA